MTRPELTIAREFEAALAWWQAAGVDCEFTDDATALLAEAGLAAAGTAQQSGKTAAERASTGSARRAANDEARQSVDSEAPGPNPAAPPPRDLLGDSPPADLPAFRQWWMTAPGLETARGFPRIAPRGLAGAALMVLVPQPETADHDRLLSGPQGRLLGNILGALGLDESEVYIASALPTHTPMADLAAIAASGMDAVLAHHMALAQPQKILAFGTDLAAFLTPVKDEHLRKFNRGVVNTPVMVSETLDAMLHVPRLKARFWRRWIEWSATV